MEIKGDKTHQVHLKPAIIFAHLLNYSNLFGFPIVGYSVFLMRSQQKGIFKLAAQHSPVR